LIKQQIFGIFICCEQKNPVSHWRGTGFFVWVIRSSFIKTVKNESTGNQSTPALKKFGVNDKQAKSHSNKPIPMWFQPKL